MKLSEMKKILPPYVLLILVFSVSACKVIIPNYTTVEGLSKLKPGMDKTEALSTLQNVYPHDIYNGEGVGCEVHEYRYKHPYQVVENKLRPLREGLRGNPEKWLRGNTAFVVYQDGKLSTVHTHEKDYLATLLVSIKEIELACNPPVYGCKDPESLNFNPVATEDDGDCVYCPCGTEKNMAYNPDKPESSCNIPCLQVCPCPEDAESNPGYDPTKPISSCNPLCIQYPEPIIIGEEESKCGPCEIVDAIANSNGAKFNVNLNLDGYLDDGLTDYDMEKSWFYKEKGRFGRIRKRSGRRKLHKSGIREPNAVRNQWVSKSLLRTLDTDNNGILTQKEISSNIAYINRNKSEIQKRIGQPGINGVDENGDGKISVTEISKLIDIFFEQD